MKFTLDPLDRCVTTDAGSTFLTRGESAVLDALMSKAGVVTYEEIAVAIWGSSTGDRHERGAIRSHLYTLRRALASVGVERPFRVVAGTGVRLWNPADGERRAA